MQPELCSGTLQLRSEASLAKKKYDSRSSAQVQLANLQFAGIRSGSKTKFCYRPKGRTLCWQPELCSGTEGFLNRVQVVLRGVTNLRFVTGYEPEQGAD